MTTPDKIHALHQIRDPRARVMQLRNAGTAIDTHWQTIATESGQHHRVGVYVLRVEGIGGPHG